MAEAAVSPRYRGLEGHACARCAKRGEWTQLRWLLDRRGEVRWVSTTSDVRLFRDDADISSVDALCDADFPGDAPRPKPGARWVHFFPVECPRCMTLFNRQTYAHHDFSEDELPLDYWADHARNVALMRRRGVGEERVAAHERMLARLGLSAPEGGGADG